MTVYLLRLEAIGDDMVQMLRAADGMFRMAGYKGAVGSLRGLRPWVAEITEIHPRYKFVREFLTCDRDYSGANSTGSRGVMLVYPLYSGRLYEVFERVTWRRSRRYFCRVTEGGELEEIDEMEVLLCLAERRNTHWASACLRPPAGASPGPSTPSPGST